MATTTPETRSYTFTALCKSGKEKTTTFEAANFTEARKKLREFIEAN